MEGQEWLLRWQGIVSGPLHKSYLHEVGIIFEECPGILRLFYVSDGYRNVANDGISLGDLLDTVVILSLRAVMVVVVGGILEENKVALGSPPLSDDVQVSVAGSK